MVIGINSTTLLESALLGSTVVSMGESLATGTGLFYDMRPDEDDAPSLENIRVDTPNAAAVLHHLLCVKQMRRDQLDDPIALMRSSIFKELLQDLNWNALNR